MCHAATAFYCSGFPDAAVLIMDGHGEGRTVSIYRGEGRALHEVRHLTLPHSLGWFCSAATEYLGWDANEGEVKLMGLALREPKRRLRRFVDDFSSSPRRACASRLECIFYGRRNYGRFFGDHMVESHRPAAPLTKRCTASS